MTNSIPKVPVILGPTASGKTKLAVRLAESLEGEIISVDSRQVYRGLNLGSGKDLHEYGNIPYHLIDVTTPLHEYSLFEYLRDAQNALAIITKRGRVPVFAGGTGLYLNAILQGYSLVNAPVNSELRAELDGLSLPDLVARLEALKKLHNATDSMDRKRTMRAIEIELAERSTNEKTVKINVRPYVIGLRCSTDNLKKRIKQRLQERLSEGMIDEVIGLQKQGISWQKLHDFGLEYRFISQHLQGQLNNNDMQQKLASAIYQFARQQLKWFRRMERNGFTIDWLETESYTSEEIVQLSKRITAWRDNPCC